MADSRKPAPTPTALTVHKQSRTLEITFDSGETFNFSFEFLRVNSPSAEVKGHGPGQEVLQTGKRDVLITALEPVGNYAVQPHFSDDSRTSRMITIPASIRGIICIGSGPNRSNYGKAT